ncbi:type I-E CRISPR-associated protein Cas7/Cse4/CasC [Rhodococcus sp. ABRD24]|uniref:type I-E CRISPR-associated protein Cas7/Cse4/CasC n=1 Tax=Rhodococcus sp. ABRD24 TaxID=2507582 RepID=UPI001039AC0D|nr:type I-E CRISPR-associated protein Cas7/Cse4/CasC [Rhodococcus sp. ABRD24]QBJ97289.1 type I-E CRISPR-associated protein Cas7/Cse4/CasC [Rhodococcus sp. ABRD24]
MSRTIVDVHILQTVPPSNINRDDTGSPKTAKYGGVRRARVSSQAWKRATRKAFEQTLDSTDLGERTKRVVELVAQVITQEAPDLAEQSMLLAEQALASTGIKIEKPKAKKGETAQPAQSGYLLFLSNNQIGNLAALAIESARSGEPIDKKAAKEATQSQHSVDLALFGRMVADAPDLNVDACAQVAHAISVHGVDNEYDYFTAVDDKAPEDNAGAGMIGTVEFNSSTLYRYATVDVDALSRTLGSGEATGRAVEAFIRSFVTSMPTGKQNTFANRTLPDAVVVQVRENQPVNLVGAFEDAVEAISGRTRMAESSKRLADYAQDLDRAFGQAPLAGFVVRVGEATKPLAALGVDDDLNALIAGVGSLVRDRVGAQP